ncbi:MAG: NADPH:quinone oxidoreductase family protein [Actinomycetota bacterium]|nr:NADPH:quinone oxidoreductase family protein [Actinomycetota bacterium]MDA3028606.1 NADPH:quinone oxidoreductase family protein [Actinomycetota bacterium]
MRAVEVQTLEGVAGIRVVDRGEPDDDGEHVIVEVVSSAVSFPDLLQSKGLYQHRREPPFIAGIEMAGVVRSAPAHTQWRSGDRVCAWTTGALAETVACVPKWVLPLPDELSFDEGAALTLNYQTSLFALSRRARLAAGETVLVLGASGGIGTSSIQVAKAMRASMVIGLVSTRDKVGIVDQAGADHAVVVSDTWRDEVLELTHGHGVDVVCDPVGGDRFHDAVRVLARYGRLAVIGFAAGEIPEIKVNRILLRNISIVGAAWGEAIVDEPLLARALHDELIPMIVDGGLRPPIGRSLPLEQAPDGYRLLDERRAVGKVVIKVRAEA